MDKEVFESTSEANHRPFPREQWLHYEEMLAQLIQSKPLLICAMSITHIFVSSGLRFVAKTCFWEAHVCSILVVVGTKTSGHCLPVDKGRRQKKENTHFGKLRTPEPPPPYSGISPKFNNFFHSFPLRDSKIASLLLK